MFFTKPIPNIKSNNTEIVSDAIWRQFIQYIRGISGEILHKIWKRSPRWVTTEYIRTIIKYKTDTRFICGWDINAKK